MPDSKPEEKPAASVPSPAVAPASGAKGAADARPAAAPSPPSTHGKASDASDKAAALAADTQKAQEDDMADTDLKDGKCPMGSDHTVERYHGDNPHKQGTYFCHTCGARRPVKS